MPQLSTTIDEVPPRQADADASELRRLRQRVDAGRPDAVRAAPALLERSIRVGELCADADRLLALARRPSTGPELAGLLEDRPAEARNFLVGLNAAAADVRSRVNVAPVRAFAEIELGEVAQARRLVDRAARLDPGAGLLPLARLAVERAERRGR